VVFTDPEDVSHGRAALAAKTAELLAGMPADFRFREVGPQYLGADQGALAWELGPPDAPVARGVDVITVDTGRIVSLLTLLTP